MSSENELLQGIQNEIIQLRTSFVGYGDRLGKIEDAIITLAATQERVNNIADELKARELSLQDFQNTIWGEIRRLNEHNTKMLELITTLKVKMEENTDKVKDLEEFKVEYTPQIKENSRFRGWGEKLGFILLVAFIMGIVGAVVKYQSPTQTEIRELKQMIEQTHKIPETGKKVMP